MSSKVGSTHTLQAEILRLRQRLSEQAAELRETQATLHRQHKLIDELQSIGRIGGWSIDALSLEVEWSEETYRIHGVNAAYEPAFKKALQFYPPTARAQLADAIDHALHQRRGFDLTLPMIDARGIHRFVRVVARVRQERHRHTVWGVVQDITPQHHARHALRKSEQRYRTLVNGLDVGVTVFSPHKELLLANPKAAAILGAEDLTQIDYEALLKATTFFDHDGIPLNETTQHPLHRAINTLNPTLNVLYGVESPYFEGRRWIRVSAYPMINDTGQLEQVVQTLVEITERRAIEQTLRERTQQLTEAERIAKLGHWSYTPNAPNPFTWSEGLKQLLHHPLDAPPPQDTAEILAMVHDDDRERLLETASLGSCNNTPFQLRVRAIRGDGMPIHAHVMCFPRLDEASQQHHYFGIIQDITSMVEADEMRRRLDAEVQRATRLESLEVLAGGIAHDFNNLLVGILGSAGLARTLINENNPAHRSVTLIEATAERAAELTRQMLAYAGRNQIEASTIDPGTLVRDMTPLLRNLITPRIQLHIEIDASLPTIHADPTQLRQLLMNLVLNASEALSDHGNTIHVDVSTHDMDATTLETAWANDARAGTFVTLVVRDDGIGMSPQTLARIFDPFFTTKKSGHGLGLAAALGIVRSHKGFIQVDSVPGQGSCFRIGFPVVSAKRNIISHLSLPALTHWQGAGTALLVEDEHTVREVVETMLKRLGFDVITARDGREALSCLTTLAPPKVVLLDMNMPHHSGREVFEAIHQAFDPRPPVLLMSGYDAANSAPELIALDNVVFLQKPFSPKRLSQVLYTLIDHG